MSIRGIVLCAVALLFSAPAAAKSSYESPYSYDQTFGTTLRLLKVDLDLEISETDSDWGYLIFVYTSRESGKRKNRGSFSFVRTSSTVQVTLQLPELPNYHEQHILGMLRHKLEDEHGAPPERPKKKPAPPKDDDADRDKDRDKDANKNRDKNTDKKKPKGKRDDSREPPPSARP